jgi:hypothetical protein
MSSPWAHEPARITNHSSSGGLVRVRFCNKHRLTVHITVVRKVLQHEIYNSVSISWHWNVLRSGVVGPRSIQKRSNPEIGNVSTPFASCPTEDDTVILLSRCHPGVVARAFGTSFDDFRRWTGWLE